LPHPISEPRLAVRGIGKRFGQTWVLRDVSLAVAPGQVHAVVGLNGSGKSTLMRAVYGAHQPSEGEILLDGVPCRFRGPRDALARGVAAVPQELPVVPELSVTENIFLGMLPATGGMIRLSAAHAEARRVLKHLHAEAEVPDVRQAAGRLSLAGQQLVTVARALVRHAGVIVFDEPTSALPGPAAARLRDVIRTLRADGEAVLFISQRLNDVLDIADELTVLRDGLAVAQGPAGAFTSEAIVHWMVHGRAPATAVDPVTESQVSVPSAPASVPAVPAGPVLTVRDLSARRLTGISLEVRAGELVGLFGLPGSGAADILRVIYGAESATAGAIILDGTPLTMPRQLSQPRRYSRLRQPRRLREQSVRRRIDRGLAYVTGDRPTTLVADLTVAANMALPGSRSIGRPVSPKAERRRASEQIRALNIQPPEPDVPVSTLSGGNQQKVILARWLTGNPKAWLLDDPTRGVDAQAQADIHEIIRDRMRQGACGLIYSSDPRELHQICDRGLLISGGRVTAEIDPRNLDADQLGSLLEGSRTP
jgi:rhamnose transport system ATP-binding protein